jgi:hypothetical protein
MLRAHDSDHSQENGMAVFKEAGLDDRKNAAAEARKAMLEKF